jgi:hypothetical protein
VNEINESLLYDLQLKIYLLMKQKYYPEFKQSFEFQKLISKNDSLKSLVNTSTSPYDEFSDGFTGIFSLIKLYLFEIIFILRQHFSWFNN